MSGPAIGDTSPRLGRVRVDLGELRRTRRMPGGRHRCVDGPTIPCRAVRPTSHASPCWPARAVLALSITVVLVVAGMTVAVGW